MSSEAAGVLQNDDNVPSDISPSDVKPFQSQPEDEGLRETTRVSRERRGLPAGEPTATEDDGFHSQKGKAPDVDDYHMKEELAHGTPEASEPDDDITGTVPGLPTFGQFSATDLDSSTSAEPRTRHPLNLFR